MSYHISPNGPRLCRATTGVCPYTAQGDDHYPTQAEAQVAYETRMAEAFGAVESLKKSPIESARQAGYKVRDEVRLMASTALNQAFLVKATPQAKQAGEFLQALRSFPAVAVRRIADWDDKVKAEALERAATREERMLRLQAMAAQSRTRIAATTVAAPAEVKSRFSSYRDSLRKSREPKAPRQKVTAAHGLRVGDTVDGLTVAKVFDQGESVKIHLRSSAGTFAGKREYKDTDLVPYYRTGKREANGRVSASRRPWRETKFAKRVKAASKLQKEVVKTLFSADASARLPREPQLKRPLPEKYRRASATVNAERAEAAVALQALTSSRKRKKTRRA